MNCNAINCYAINCYALPTPSATLLQSNINRPITLHISPAARHINTTTDGLARHLFSAGTFFLPVLQTIKRSNERTNERRMNYDHVTRRRAYRQNAALRRREARVPRCPDVYCSTIGRQGEGPGEGGREGTADERTEGARKGGDAVLY